MVKPDGAPAPDGFQCQAQMMYLHPGEKQRRTLQLARELVAPGLIVIVGAVLLFTSPNEHIWWDLAFFATVAVNIALELFTSPKKTSAASGDMSSMQYLAWLTMISTLLWGFTRSVP